MIQAILAIGLAAALSMMFMQTDYKVKSYTKTLVLSSDLKAIKRQIIENFSCEETLGPVATFTCVNGREVQMKNQNNIVMNPRDKNNKPRMFSWEVRAYHSCNEGAVGQIQFRATREGIHPRTKRPYSQLSIARDLFKGTLSGKCSSHFSGIESDEEVRSRIASAYLVKGSRPGDLQLIAMPGSPRSAFRLIRESNLVNLSRRSALILDPKGNSINESKWKKVMGVRCNSNRGYFFSSCSSKSNSLSDTVVLPNAEGCVTNDLKDREDTDFEENQSALLVISCIKRRL